MKTIKLLETLRYSSATERENNRFFSGDCALVSDTRDYYRCRERIRQFGSIVWCVKNSINFHTENDTDEFINSVY